MIKKMWSSRKIKAILWKTLIPERTGELLLIIKFSKQCTITRKKITEDYRVNKVAFKLQSERNLFYAVPWFNSYWSVLSSFGDFHTRKT